MMFSPPPPATCESPAVHERKARTLRPEAAASVTFRLSDDAVLAFIGGRNVVFSQRRQRIYQLNDAAAYLACRLEQGARYDELHSDLVGNGAEPRAAAATIEVWLSTWSRAGIAGAEIALRPGQEWRQCSLSVGPATFALFHHDPALLETVIPAFRHLVVGAREGSTDYYLSSGAGFVFIGKGKQMASIVTPEQAVPALKAMLVDDVLGAAQQSIALHAACLIEGNGALLLSGPPGAGKSTLTLALLAADFGYGADDVTLLDAQGRVQGIPFAPALKDGAARLFPDLKGMPLYQRLDGRRLRYWPVEREPRHDWIPVRWLVKLQRRRGASARLVKSEPMDALADIMREAWSKSRQTSPDVFRTLKSVVAGARCYQLHYSDLDEAVELLKRLCRND